MKKVLVVGGSEEYVGAVYLAAIAALRAGAESVIVMAPEKVAWALNTISPDIMTRKLKGRFLSTSHAKTIKKLLKTADILLIGNGAGVHPHTSSLMRTLSEWPGLKVIDADALKALRGTRVKNAILTPNEGEWEMLQKGSDIKKLLEKNVIIQKGRHTRILSANKTYRQKRTNPGLEKAGMGDVLAGLCAGFLACLPRGRRLPARRAQAGRQTQGLTLWDAAKKAADIGNTIAGILSTRKKGYYFLASDIVNELSRARKQRTRKS